MTRVPDESRSIRGRIASVVSPELVALALVIVLAIAIIVALYLASAGQVDASRVPIATSILAPGWPRWS